MCRLVMRRKKILRRIEALAAMLHIQAEKQKREHKGIPFEFGLQGNVFILEVVNDTSGSLNIISFFSHSHE